MAGPGSAGDSRRSGLPALLPLVLLLALAGAAAAAPADSLGGTDMLAAHQARRARIAESIGEGVAVLFAAPSAGHHEYRSAPGLFYLTGIDDPGAALVIRVVRPEATARSRATRSLERRLLSLAEEIAALGRQAARAPDGRALSREASLASGEARAAARTAATLAARERGPARVEVRLYLRPARRGQTRWVGPRLVPGAEAAAATGIADVRPISALFGDLERDLAVTPDLWIEIGGPAPGAYAERLEGLVSGRPRSLEPHLNRLRAVKDAEEIARIRKACELTARGLVAAIRSARPGLAEYELQAILEYECRRGGARQAFRSIVGSGPNSVIVHYAANRRVTVPGDLVLMDVGAEVLGYAADVTRTFPVNARFTEEQARVYEVVLEAQMAAIAAVRPGATLSDVHRAAAAVVRKSGGGHSLLHGVSHHVGLDVHDPAPRGPLAAGMVITVEPGIYLPDLGFGIRIEDTVLVTEDGAEVLSAAAPKARSEIEALRSEPPSAERNR